MGRKREAVIRTGKRLFLAQGIADTGMEQIAEAVPVSKMTLYNIFGNKEGLLEAVIDSMIQEGLGLFDEAVREASDPLDALNRLAAIQGLETEMSAEFLRDLQNYPGLMQRLMAASADVMPRFEKIILEAQQQGFIRKDLSPFVIVAYLKFMKEFVARPDTLLGLGSPQWVGEQLRTIFYHGILVSNQPKQSDGT